MHISVFVLSFSCAPPIVGSAMLSGAEVALVAVFSLLVVVNLAGNSLVCLVVYKNRTMRTPMNFLLVNLALADMLVALGVAPQYVFNHTFSHPQGKAGMYLCKFITGGNLLWVGGTASMMTLVAIAFERYYAIVHPYLERGRMTVKKVALIVLASWVVAFVIQIAPFYVVTYGTEQGFCVEAWPRLSDAKFYTSFVLCTNVILPLGIMTFLFTKIIRNLWGRNNRVSDAHMPRIVVMKTRKKLTKMILMVTAIYALCWSPALTFYNLAYFNTSVQYGSNAYNASVVFVCLNSSVNPFIYALQSERFRTAFRKLLCSCGGTKRGNPGIQPAEKTRNRVARAMPIRLTRIAVKPTDGRPGGASPADGEEAEGNIAP